METDQSISTAFVGLLEAHKYDEISIADICKTANVSRKTFYRYFDNKEALVRNIIREDFVNPIINLREILPLWEIKSANTLLLERWSSTLDLHRGLYLGLVSTCGWSWLADMMIDENYKMQSELYRQPDFDSYNFSEPELEFITYFFSAAPIMVALWWLRAAPDIDAKKLAKFHDAWILAHWRELAQEDDSRDVK